MSNMDETKWEMCSLSSRGKRYIAMEQPMSVFAKLKRDSYDEESNPQGVIDLATCDNKIVGDLVVPKLSQSVRIEERDTHYFPFDGSIRFRKTIADFFERFMKPANPIKVEDIFVTNGCAALGHSLACILCDPGDGILIPTPYYYGFDADFTLQPEVLCYPVNISERGPDGNNSYELSVVKLEAALKRAKQENMTIRALLLCNPHNPLGTIYSKESVQQCLEFAQKHSLHVISDEIYMLTGYKGCPWSSAASLSKVIDPNLLHIMWGFSKDFGLSGLRVGVLFSRNRGVIEAMNAISYYHAVPPIIQNSLESLINDQAWLETIYLPTFHERVRNCVEIVSKELQRLNVRVNTPSAGLFIWANFCHYMEPPTFETEKALRDMFIEHGILLSAGSIFASSEPGWFRIVVASDPAILKIATKRIKTALSTFRKRREVPNSMMVGSSSDGASLEELVGQLKLQIGQSGWLKENTAEKWIAENPKLAKEFMDGKFPRT